MRLFSRPRLLDWDELDPERHERRGKSTLFSPNNSQKYHRRCRNPFVTIYLTPYKGLGSLGALHEYYHWTASNFLGTLLDISPVLKSVIGQDLRTHFLLLERPILGKDDRRKATTSFFSSTSWSSHWTFSMKCQDIWKVPQHPLWPGTCWKHL